jgi:hypothetical protein
MDGVYKDVCPIIQEQLPWVQCFVCPSHTIDSFIKNALSDTTTIRIQVNAMSHVEFATIPWGETVFTHMRQSGKLFSIWCHTRSPWLSFAKSPV